jgi:uncharacterized membrane protein
MTPILGTMLAIALGDGRNLGFSLMLWLSGAGTAVFIGYLVGLCVESDSILSENNSQIAARVSPKLTDLVAAFATGAVGSIALVRSDVADTLPGVAISISLVPPLCVVGLTLSTGDGHDAAGAILLFFTNVAAILSVGVVVMLFYKVQKKADPAKMLRFHFSVLLIMGLLACVVTPLVFTAKQIHDQYDIERCLKKHATEWAEPQGWKVSIVVAKTSQSEVSKSN